MTVINLFKPRAESIEPTLAGPTVCMGCRHEWVAVAPVGTVTFRCPACELDKGVAAGFVLKAEEESFHCGCGGFLFVIHRSQTMCAACGERAAF